jgi:hypothetical protein
MPDGSATIISANHRAARAYAERGWAVFPCWPNAKEPAVTGGFHAATTDIAQIDHWWSENPNYNIGFDPASAGLCVVDLDTKEQKDGTTGLANWQKFIAEHGSPETFRVRTPSGGGHVYFKGTLGSTAGKIAPGIDTRGGNTGYVLVPPSYVVDPVKGYEGSYCAEGEIDTFAPLPEWISQAVNTPRYHDQETRDFVERSQKVPVPQDDLVAILRHLDPDCGYDEWYRYVGAIRATRLAGVSEDETDARLLEITQAWSRGDYWPITPEQWEGDVDTERKFWAMPPKPGGTTFGTLYRAARAAGYTKPPPGASDKEAFAEAIKNAGDDKAKVAKGEWPLTHIRDRRTALNVPDPEMLVAEIIPNKKLIMPWGDTGCGKTYWGAELVTAVPMRRPAFGKFAIVKPGDAGIAVIFAGEDCDFLDKSRLTAIETHYQQSLQGLVYTVQTAIPINDLSLFEAYRSELKRLQDITGRPIDIVLNDTLKRSLGLLKQNDDDTARRFTMSMEGLIDEFGCTIICNAHEAKSGPDGGIAGSGDFTANCPVTPHLIAVRDGGKLMGISCRFEPKFRIGPAPEPFTVKTVAVPLPRPVAGFTSDLVLRAMSAEEEAQRPTPAREARLSEQEDCREIERVCGEHGAHDLDSGMTTEVITLSLAGARREGESENDYAARRHAWKQRLDNGARRPEGNPRLARYFAMDNRGGEGTLRIPRPIRKWFVARPSEEPPREGF